MIEKCYSKINNFCFLLIDGEKVEIKYEYNYTYNFISNSLYR